MFIKNQNKMLKDIVDIIKDTCLKHKGVRTFKYQDKSWNNAQNNYATYQAYLSTVSYHRLNITTNIFRSEFELYILGQPKKDDEEDTLKVQNDCYTIINNILARLDNLPEYKNVISLYDYDIMVLAHYSDDDSAGVKCSIVLATPSPVSLCDLDDNFNDEPYPEPTDTPQIDIDAEETPEELTLKTIKLPRNPRC